MANPLVALMIAWEWMCPLCGFTQYASAAPETMTESEIQEAAKMLEVDPESLRGSGMAVIPAGVRCKECKERFPVSQPAEEE